MPGRRCWYLVTLAGCFVFYLCYQEWFSWVLLLLLLIAPAASLVLSWYAMVTFFIRVEGPDRVNMGQAREVALMGGSEWPVPPFRGGLRMEHTLTGQVRCSRFDRLLPTDHCGTILVEPEKTYVFDYLGLFRFRVRNTAPLRITVMPKPVKLSGIPDVDRFLARAWRPKPGGGYAENHELRLYRPGDSISQIHWKLTAKTGKPIIREPMEPQRGMALVTADIRGTPEDLDRLFGQLLWLGLYLLSKTMPFSLRAMTGEGILSFRVEDEDGLQGALDALLAAKPAGAGSVLDGELSASWHCHVGGAPHES